MGKHWRKKGNKNKGDSARLGQRRSQRQGWEEIVKENAEWERYYKEQGIVASDEEFAKMKKAFQDPLPVTFRFTGSSGHVLDISKFFTEKIIPKMEEKDRPSSLSWYPKGLAYQINLEKRVIKKDPAYAPVQGFLVAENEVGNLSRQEAVSMIPPLFLDVKPEHYVLDMCAAPGSKTAQLVEGLHSAEKADNGIPSGFVIANDSDYRRSYMLVHQIKRLNSPNYIVVNHDAQMFPKIRLEENGPYVKFDRILCDVPCSGDGTFRKNFPIWDDWKVGNALGLHRLQLNILLRGIQLLKAGGRLVYSTCSLNPIEDEAVVAAALKQYGGRIRTVDCHEDFPTLIRRNGLTSWKVFNKNFELQQEGAEDIVASAFPPKPEEVADLHLENCMRVYPHDQNTGGFFITVIEKPVELNQPRKRTLTEEEGSPKKQKTAANADDDDVVEPIIAPEPAKKQRLPFDANEEPFSYVAKDNEELAKCWKFFGISDGFPKDCTMVRNATGEPMRTIYFTSPTVKKLVECNKDKLKLVYTGVRLFVSQKSNECAWRIQNDSVAVMKNFMSGARQTVGNMAVFKSLLEEDFPSLGAMKDANIDPDFVESVSKAPEGSCFLNVKREGGFESLLLPMWKGAIHVNLMVDKHEKAELLYRFFGIDKNAIEKQKRAEAKEAEVKKAEAEKAE